MLSNKFILDRNVLRSSNSRLACSLYALTTESLLITSSILLISISPLSPLGSSLYVLLAVYSSPLARLALLAIFVSFI